MSDIDHVALNQDSRANFRRKIIYAATQQPNWGLVLNRLRNRRARRGIADLLTNGSDETHFGGQVHWIEHHLAHLYSAYYVSPFAEATVASIDGFGDFSSAAWGVGKGGNIAIDGRVFSHIRSVSFTRR